MLWSLTSTPYSLAISNILLVGLTLNPIIIALDAFAKTTSLSVIVPTPLLITFKRQPSTSILESVFLTLTGKKLRD